MNTISVENGAVFNNNKTVLYLYPAGKQDADYTIPATVEYIGNGAFDYNHNLKNLTFGEAVHYVHSGTSMAFDPVAPHSEIENILVDPLNPYYGSSNGVLYELATKRAIWSPMGKTQVRIAEPVEVIAGGGSQNSMFGTGNSTRNYIDVITLVDLPATLTEIQDGAFAGAANLATVIIRTATIPTASTSGNTPFRAAGGGLTPAWSMKLYIPAAALDAYKQAWNPSFSNNNNNFIGFYNIDLTNATAQSSIATDIAVDGDNVTATADVAPAGYVFDKWISTTHPELLTGQETSSSISFTMPAADVELTATFKSTTVSIEENTQSGIAVYPNPATDYIQLTKADNSSYSIYSVNGQLVLAGVTSGKPISVSNLVNGIYIIKAEGKAMQFIKK
jgi:hypothetical protein